MELGSTKGNSLALLAGAGIASLCFIARSALRGLVVDWDIDTFIAISQSFLRGNQLYIDFFDPKWPHIQWLYIPGALSRSLSVHLLTGWLAILGTGFAITMIGLGHNTSKHRAAVAAGPLYVAIAPLLPGGNIGHLEVMSNLFMGVGVWLIAKGAGRQRDKRKCLYSYCGSTAIGFCIGTRPNLLIPAVLIGTVMYLRRRDLRISRLDLYNVYAGLAGRMILLSTPTVCTIFLI